jgi:peptidoglycan hydrolase CwlO-like protein
MSEKLLDAHVQHLEDLIAVHKDNEARMAKRIAKLVKERDEANWLAEYYRQESRALQERLYTMVAVGGTA